MANYYGTARTNYVTLRDDVTLDDWNKIIETIESDDNGIKFTTNINEKGQTQIALLGVINGTYPLNQNNTIDDNADILDADETYKKIQKLLSPDEVLVYREIGNEKLRYLIGLTTIVTPTTILHSNLDSLTETLLETANIPLDTINNDLAPEY